MPIPLFQVDAFTAESFRGNPAAVCLLDDTADGAWMQSVATEMNLSETAFVAPAPDGDSYTLRWFTPKVEVDLCGHATLATAHTLWESYRLDPEEEARFHTASGELTCTVDADETIWMDFPALVSAEIDEPAGLAAALGVTPVRVARNHHQYLVELASVDEVRQLRPDLARIAAIETRAVVVTALAKDGDGCDFVSRCFAPRVGIDEDPVTGSAHCALGPWWAARRGRTRLVGYQASARGGVVQVEVQGERVRLGGHAVTVLRGELVP
ncbi:MAG: PhzF family phenazine biosynthesis protein [Acidimicrobiia bacterium]